MTSSGNGRCHQKAKEERISFSPFEATVTEGNECQHSWDYVSYW